MSRIEIKSIFESISQTVFTSTLSLPELKQFIISYVDERKINTKDKKIIIYNINTCQSKIRLQTYICNSLLQYEGLGTGRHNHSDHGDDIDNIL